MYSSPDTIGVIISRTMIWAGRVARIGYKKGAYSVSVEKLEGKILLG